MIYFPATPCPVASIMRRSDDSAILRYFEKFGGGRLFAQIVELIEDRFRHNVLLELFEFASVYVQIESQMIRYGAGHGGNLCYLVLRKEAHLQIEVGMLAVSLGHAILSDEDEGGQKNGFDRGHYAE
jgi:hypothetical protein